MNTSQTYVIVFDLDGTLVDTARVVTDILNALRFDLGKSGLTHNKLLPWLSLGGEDLIQAALEVGRNDAIQYLKKFREIYFETPTPQASVYPEVFPTLSALTELGFHLSICTNKPRFLANKVLEETNLDSFFRFVSASDDLPSKKPQRENLDACLNYYALKSEQAFLVGDSSVDQKLAENARVPFVFFELGYDDGVDKNQAVFSMQSHFELVQYLKKSLLL
ncbi:HAD hydrolase-like protein [Gammaproteobacteria bacterium]|nr:HAD hydrolase-like protein [Gammaproteobacteria bacterium]